MVQHFRSSWSTGAARVLPNDPGLGQAWAHNHAVSLVFAGSPATTASILIGDGSLAGFAWDSLTSAWKPAFGTNLLTPLAGGGFRFTRADDDTKWQFDSAGRLVSITLRNGWVTTYTYSDATASLAVAPRAGLLIRVTNQFGRSLGFVYNSAGHLTSVNTPDSQSISFSFDSSQRLAAVAYPGGVSKTYVYEDVNWPKSVTGIVDERGIRLATVAYDAQGRATSSGYTGGADQYSVAYGATATDPVQVIDPLGSARIYTYGLALNKLAVTSASRPSGSGNPDAASRVQNASGLIDSETDFLGVQTMYTWDITRRLPLATTKAANRPEAQTTSTQWHATFRLPMLVTEPGRTTAYTYDALGNKLTETVTDTATGQSRTWAWSYNPQGLIATSTDPRGSVSSYTYDAAGNQTSFRNALNQATTFTYDAAGRVLTQTDPNGLVTAYAYDARGRVLSMAQGGSGAATETTNFTYTPSGQVASTAQPNGYAATYIYDAAQRLVGATDNRGNSIAYTLDGMGNRTREEVKDSTGAIAKLTTRTVNQLNRLASQSGAAGQTSQFAYDANAEATASTDPLNQTTRQSLDPLRRPTATTFADNAVATQTWSQLNQVASVTDPKAVTTAYTRNAFGEVMTEASPDTGSTSYTRDAAGNIASKTDARGFTTTYTRDALGRATSTTFGSGTAQAFTHQFTYDSAGNVSQFTDPSGSTTYSRDVFGRVLQKTQTVADSPTAPSAYNTAYLYHPGGQVAQITYPSGLKVFYRKNAVGQISQMDVQQPGGAVVPFVTGLTYTALGQPKAWAWSNGSTANRTFDADGRMTGNEFATYTYDNAGRIIGITQHLRAKRAVKGVSTLFTTPLSFTAGYDNRDRITSFSRNGSTRAYTYDTNGNRLSAQTAQYLDFNLSGAQDPSDPALAVQQSLNLAATSNRLLGFSQTQSQSTGGTAPVTTQASAQVSYSLDTAGNLTGDGLRVFSYNAANRLSQTTVSDADEGSKITYLHNALGQRVFKSEPKVDHVAPQASVLGTDFVSWLQANFGWLFALAQSNATLGQSYVYDDALGEVPMLLGEYGNGGSNSSGRKEYLWLPVNGQAMPIGVYTGPSVGWVLYSVHADHLNTPRLVSTGPQVTHWQWPYSAFGDERPVGQLVELPAGSTPAPYLVDYATGAKLTAFEPSSGQTSTPDSIMNLRYPGQYFDSETGLSYNYFRTYQATQGRYTQSDPIGLVGGLNRFAYVDNDPLNSFDPDGLAKNKPNATPTPIAPIPNGGGRVSNQGKIAPIPFPPPFVKPSVDQCPPGYDRTVKDPPFNPHGQKVFTNGQNFITPDVDQHNGGTWKMFDRRGNRIGTFDGDLNRIGK